MGEKSRTGWGVLANICPVCGVVHKGNRRYCSKHIYNAKQTQVIEILADINRIIDLSFVERNQL